jgi:hypothetical protein
MITAPTLIAFATVVIGGFNLFYAGRLVWRSRRVRRWPTVDGELVSAALERRKYIAAQAAWGLRVLYQYTSGTQTYRGAKISPDWGPAFFSEELGRLAITQRWRPGTPVKVHVNPNNPEDAMLTPRVSFAILLMLVLGGAMTAAGVIELLSL